jgi:hypothetical protein
MIPACLVCAMHAHDKAAIMDELVRYRALVREAVEALHREHVEFAKMRASRDRILAEYRAYQEKYEPERTRALRAHVVRLEEDA